jgi:hypothetical protein
MPYAKTPELEALRRERIRKSKLGKKRGSLTPEWRKRISDTLKRKGIKPPKDAIKLSYESRKAKGFLTPEQKREHRKRYYLNHKNQYYQSWKTWVAKNLERRREIARLSARRRRAITPTP